MAQYLKKTIQASDDGAKFLSSSWIYDFNGFDIGEDNTAAVRFQEVNIVEGTIDSAFLRLRYNGNFQVQFSDPNFVSNIGNSNVRIYGIAEDNTDDFTTDPTSRERTEAFVDWDISITEGTAKFITSPDISAIIQEIIDRGGWDGNNAIGLIIADNNSEKIVTIDSFEGAEANRPRLEINYTGTTRTPTTTTARSRIYNPRQYGVKIMKPGFPLNDPDPANQVFNSDFGTLKYFASGIIQVNNSEGCGGSYEVFNHNLGYFPYVEVFVRIPSVNSNYVYAPAAQLGAKFEFFYTYEVTTTQIKFIIGNGGEFADTAYFKYFVFKNDLGL